MPDVPEFALQERPQHDLRRIGAHPDHWYPLAWSREVKRGRPYAAQFAGEPIVLVRPHAGPVYALEDRCAHRQVPLSQGVVDGDALRCCYHGWTYDATGRCTDVPYLGKGKLPNGVRAYPCREKDGLIFVWPGDGEAGALPDLGHVADPAFKVRRFGRVVGCHYSFMHENLMDMNHQFLHRKQMGQIAPRYVGRRAGPDWIECDYTFARTGGRQPWGEAAILGRRSGASTQHRDLMRIRTQYPHQTLKIWISGDDPVMQLWINYVPVDRAQRSNRTFGLIQVRRPKVPLLLDLAWPVLVWFTERIFAEDRAIVEMEQAAHDRQGADWNQEVFPVIRELRALLAECGAPMDTPVAP
ncbi:aromatic ring-hydroxylating oxygenase subunit alpha [Acidisphaera rubrifaciens]|nr:aromatic ring-hydroxylating dioxygenase subunit alpha [Acidisphaera rubrifaciens]